MQMNESLGIGGYQERELSDADCAEISARAQSQAEHKYKYHPTSGGYSAICSCGDIYTAAAADPEVARDRAAELIGAHIERCADRDGRRARGDLTRKIAEKELFI